MNETSVREREEILDYYRKRASTDKYATSPDFNLREIEIEYLAKWLNDGLSILDVGCGNGYSDLCHGAMFDSRFVGLDFVPEMIEAAKQTSRQFRLKGSVKFQVGDVLDLQFPNSNFDIVISQRCLLNLPTREDQWQAMREISRVLKPEGNYLMLEGTLQGLKRLNNVRSRFGLDPIPEAAPKYNWFSNKFDEDEMLEVADTLFEGLETIQRFGMYYFISRVIHPLLVSPEEPKYDASINAIARQICSKIPNYEDLGHVALFIFRR
jgi:ubiquinone/menaquinone biosynthesis C-methylase UbiE